MKRFKNILFVVDASEQEDKEVTAKVQSLASRNKAKVVIAAVAAESLMDSLGPKLFSRFKELINVERKYLQDKLDAIANESGWDGIDVSKEILAGKDFISIIRKVLSDEHDLVVKARSAGPETDVLAMRLFRKCPCPVWIINCNAEHAPLRILGAVDLGAVEPEEYNLNKKIVELTTSLAVMENGEAHFIHVWQLEHEKTMRGPRFRVSDEEIDRMKAELLESRKAAFRELLTSAKAQVTPDFIHLIEGDAQEIIQEQLHQLEADVLVMGTVARTGLPGLLIGNKAEEVLSNVQSTVLAVKPSGFQTPVTL